jgi:hypothetical protein
MKYKLTIFIVILLSTFGCKPSLIFTEQQFVGTNSDASIPEKWHGEWSADEVGGKYYIERDSFSIGGLDYKIIKSKMNFGLDSANGKDKLIFQDNWCCFCRYVEVDSSTSLSGYQVLVASIDNKGNINCWEMSYDYFLKNRLVNKIPTIKFITTNITKDGIYQKIEPRIVYAEIPDKCNKYEFNRLIKSTSIATEEAPYFCNGSYDFDFFRNIAISRTPDLILTSTKKAVKRKENKNEIKYKKISNKNLKKKYIKLVTE